MRWGRLVRELIDAAATSGEERAGIRKVVRVNRAIAVNDEPGATTSAAALQDSPVTQTGHE